MLFLAAATALIGRRSGVYPGVYPSVHAGISLSANSIYYSVLPCFQLC